MKSSIFKAVASCIAALSCTAAFSATTEEPLIEILPKVEQSCTSALVNRVLVLTEVGETIAEKSGAGAEVIHELRQGIKARGEELISAVGAITGSSLYKSDSLPTTSKDAVIRLLGVCEQMKTELPEFESAIKAAEADGIYLAHVEESFDVVAQVGVLEQFVLVKNQRDLVAHSHFEELLKSLLQVEALEAEILKLQKQL